MKEADLTDETTSKANNQVVFWQRTKQAVVILLASIALLLCSCVAPSTSDVSFEEATLIYVVDGDTLCVQASSSEGPQKVRLIGIDTPESVAPDEYLEASGKQNTQEGLDATAFVASLLSQDATVFLQYDTEREDKYGRVLAYVWLEKPTDPRDIDEVRSKMLNGILLAEGFATVMPIEPNTAYKSLFAEIAA